jgi:hypothetical protein
MMFSIVLLVAGIAIANATSAAPTAIPTTAAPTAAPTDPTAAPTEVPSLPPTYLPTSMPSFQKETWGQVTYDKKRCVEIGKFCYCFMNINWNVKIDTSI